MKTRLSVDDMTAADVQVGQTWHHVVTFVAERAAVWTVDRVDHDRVTMRGPGDACKQVTLGHLLAYWIPAE